MGFEPTIFAVTGRYVWPLHHRAVNVTKTVMIIPHVHGGWLFEKDQGKGNFISRGLDKAS